MCGGAGRRRDPLALQVLERLDALVGAHPELRGSDLDVVDQEHLALSARREVREYGTGRQHVEATADQGLEDFKPGIELAQFEIEALLLEGAAVHAGPDLSVNRDRVQIADANFGLGLRDGRAPEQTAELRGRRLWSGIVVDPWHLLHTVFCDYSENEAGRICACCARYSLMTSSLMWLRSSPNSGRSCSNSSRG